MSTNNLVSRLRFLAAIALVAGFASAAHAQGTQEAIEEATKQTSRQISDSISRRLQTQAIQSSVGAGVAPAGQMQERGSAWLTATYNNLDFKFRGLREIDADLTQTIVGGDLRFGRFFAGLSGSWAHVESRSFGDALGGGSIEANTFAVQPYFGAMLTDHIFPLAILGYSFLDVERSGISADTFSSDLSMNYSNLIGNIVARAKTGWRFANVDADIPGERDQPNVDLHTLYLGATLGYKFGDLMPYMTAQYEYNATGNLGGIDRDFVYLTTGLDYQVLSNLTAGIAFQAEVANRNSDNLGGILNFRFRF